MANDWRAVSVPAPPPMMRDFLNLERDQFLTTLRLVREQVVMAVQPLGVYKIYGREEKQGESESGHRVSSSASALRAVSSSGLRSSNCSITAFA